MDLWIRSQDKLLLTKIDYIVINGSDFFNQNQLIGTYSSYERALEVLDEIQRLIKASLVDKNLDGYGVVIYEMPKE